nr:hypothetical protein [Tanacetum cinerariifolium]
MPRRSFDNLASHLQDVMFEALPKMVDDHIKEKVKRQVPEQVKGQVPVYVAEGLILEREQNKEAVRNTKTLGPEFAICVSSELASCSFNRIRSFKFSLNSQFQVFTEFAVLVETEFAILVVTEFTVSIVTELVTNIILQGLLNEISALLSHHKVAKDLWERIQLLMQGTSLTKLERECKLYDEFDKFACKKGETLLHHNIYSPQPSIPQLEYVLTVNQQQQQPKFLPLDLGLNVPVFKHSDDPIDAINHMMSFLTSVVKSRYPPTNNQLKNSLNPKQQATINDGIVTLQQVQGRQISFASVSLMANLSHYGSDALAKPEQRDLPKDNPFVRIEVLMYNENGSKVRKGEMRTKTELTLKQTQQGVSDEVLNIRVMPKGIYSDDGNPSRANIKQALR